MTVDEIHEVSKIDHWFLRRLERIAKHSRTMEVRMYYSRMHQAGEYSERIELLSFLVTKNRLPRSHYRGRVVLIFLQREYENVR